MHLTKKANCATLRIMQCTGSAHGFFARLVVRGLQVTKPNRSEMCQVRIQHG